MFCVSIHFFKISNRFLEYTFAFVAFLCYNMHELNENGYSTETLGYEVD